jgi:hypothetical protein
MGRERGPLARRSGHVVAVIVPLLVGVVIVGNGLALV